MLNAYVGSCMVVVDPVFGSFIAVADLIVPVLETNQTSDSLHTNDTLYLHLCVCVGGGGSEGSGEIVECVAASTPWYLTDYTICTRHLICQPSCSSNMYAT